jgi:transposase-like protein
VGEAVRRDFCDATYAPKVLVSSQAGSPEVTLVDELTALRAALTQAQSDIAELKAKVA